MTNHILYALANICTVALDALGCDRTNEDRWEAQRIIIKHVERLAREIVDLQDLVRRLEMCLRDEAQGYCNAATLSVLAEADRVLN